MPTKPGRIVELLRIGPKFAQILLSGGEKVELPLGLWEDVQANYSPDQALVFVERRGLIFNYVQWVGTHDEAQRAVTDGLLKRREYTGRAQLEGMFDGYGTRLIERLQRAQEAVVDVPWRAEALARGAAARDREFRIEMLYDSMNPFFCLSFESLVVYGITTAGEIEAVRQLVRSQEFPHRWWNPMMLRDLEILDTQEDALVRIGLWFKDQDSNP